ncbi:MAG: hypothetical protein ACSLFM_10335 [Tepidiformaceae bacterium]
MAWAFVFALAAATGAGCGGDEVVDRPRTTAVPSETPESSSLAEWAEGFCAVLEEFEVSVRDVTPSEALPFAERQVKALANFEVFRASLAAAVDGFGELSPPATAKAYHDASVDQWEAILESYEAAIPVLEDAETAVDIEAVNDGLLVAREAAGAAFETRVVLVAPAVATELAEQAECGGLTE